MSIADQERDDVLLRRAAKGDEEAFTLLYRRHQAALYRFALRMTGSTWAAEEIVQDVFMMLMRDPRKYDATRGTLGGFLYGVTRNRVLKHLERLPREVPLEEQHDNGTGLGIVLRGASTPAMQAEEHERVERDRKSTRLNSSHGYISYAVFCLKKKKNERHSAKMMNEDRYTMKIILMDLTRQWYVYHDEWNMHDIRLRGLMVAVVLSELKRFSG